jgi:hypothetical protein
MLQLLLLQVCSGCWQALFPVAKHVWDLNRDGYFPPHVTEIICLAPFWSSQ